MSKYPYSPRRPVSSTAVRTAAATGAATVSSVVSGTVDATVAAVFWRIALSVNWSAATVSGDSTCSQDQVTHCRSAVSQGHPGDLSAAGQCHVKPYVHFTHVCTVNNYVPGAVDFCCCHVTNPDKLFCCRYHQDWYHFRCRESTDSIPLSHGNEYNDVASITRIVASIAAFLLITTLIAVIGYMRCRRQSNSYRGNHAPPKPAASSCFYVGDGEFPANMRRPSFCDDISASSPDSRSFQILQRPTSLEPSAPVWQGDLKTTEEEAEILANQHVSCRYFIHPPPLHCNGCIRAPRPGRGHDCYGEDCDVTARLVLPYDGMYNWNDASWRTHAHSVNPLSQMTSLPPPYTD